MARAIEEADLDGDKRKATEDELEATRDRQDKLRGQMDVLERRVDDAQRWIGLDNESLRDAISCSLEILGVGSLNEGEQPDGQPQQFHFPDILEKLGGDPSWTTTLDTLRKPPEDGESGFQWRKEAAIRPVVFDAPATVDDSVVQLHLHHRIVQRLLGRFLSQGFVHFDLSRACLGQSRDAVPRVVLLGRLSLYGPGATRLHEEVLTVTARWSDPAARKEPLTPYARDAEARTMAMLEDAMRPTGQQGLADTVQTTLLDALPQDIQELLPHLKDRGEAARQDAEKALTARGHAEAKAMTKVLKEQRERVLRELGREVQMQLFHDTERKQYESNRRYWQNWVENVEEDLEREPARILEFYRVNSYRIEPVGIAYLHPAEA